MIIQGDDGQFYFVCDSCETVWHLSAALAPVNRSGCSYHPNEEVVSFGFSDQQLKAVQVLVAQREMKPAEIDKSEDLARVLGWKSAEETKTKKPKRSSKKTP